MKEYVAEAGGRYTYVDDILNLQELTLSMTSIFTDCANFIISGCEVVSDNEITSGYVWINKKIRYFEGSKGIKFPYYLVEKNTVDSVMYAKEAVKRGRNNYLCVGSQTKPTESLTKTALQFIEVTPSYAPRFIDKFIGKYAVLLETPFSKQTIKKNLVVAGDFSADKAIESKTSVSINHPASSHVLKSIVKGNGNGSVGLYYNGLLVNELSINTDGSFTLLKQDKVIAKFTIDGVLVDSVSHKTIKVGSICLSDNHIINITSDNDNGEVDINYTGFNNETSRFRNFTVYDGKKNAILQVKGGTKEINANGKLTVKNAGDGLVLLNAQYTKDNVALTNTLQWADSKNENIASVGFDSDQSQDFNIKNIIGNITLTPKTYVDIQGELKIKGENISSIYANKTDLTNSLNKKVDKVEGKQLSTEDFTTALKDKLDGIAVGDLTSNTEGFVTGKVVKDGLDKKANKLLDGYNSDEKKAIAKNIDVYTKSEADGKYASVSSLFQDYINYQISKGTSQADAQKALRNKINCPGNEEVLKKSNKLSDLPIANEEDKKQICNRLGAAYAKEYQAKLNDTGWLQMGNSGSETDTSGLYIRQIGDIVSIQGKVNTAKRNGSNMGGVVAVIPNQIDPPRYGLKTSLCDYNDDHKYNRGATFVIQGGNRNLLIYESGWYNVNTELNFTYMI